MGTPIRYRSGSLRSELDIATQVVEPSNKAQDHLGAITTRKVISAQVLIFDAVLKHVIGSREHGSGHSEDGLLGAASGFQAQELALQLGAFDSYRLPRLR